MSVVDPITLGVLWGGLTAVSVEVGSALQRTAYSIQAREGFDLSAAVFDADGRMSAQGPYNIGHLGAMNFVVGTILEYFPRSDLENGDVLILNDPQLGSGHLPDVYLVRPCFWQKTLIGFVANVVHHTDVGGASPASQAVEGVMDSYQEGMRIPPTKLMRRSNLNEDLLEVLVANSRAPADLRGDLTAQLASLRLGEGRLVDIFQRFGQGTVGRAIDQLLEETESSVRERIRAIPDGRYHFFDHMDDYGSSTPPLRIEVTVVVTGSELEVDFAGTDRQTESGMNAYLNYTRAYSFAAIKAVTDPDGPVNGGALRPIRVTAPVGSLLNPTAPAASGARAVLGPRIFEVVVGALAQAVPENVMAASSHYSNATFGALDRTGHHFLGYELVFGGWGARSSRDGCEALAIPPNSSNIPVEAVEARIPEVVERFELIPDSCGAGEYRGGCGVRRDVRILGDRIRLSNLSERHTFPPWGLFGGEPGALGRTVINPGTESEREISGKASVDLEYGDVVSFQLAGGGGYGDPLDRSPEAVLRDISDGYVGRAESEKIYGVIVSGLEPEITVDIEATLQRRATIRASRIGVARSVSAHAQPGEQYEREETPE